MAARKEPESAETSEMYSYELDDEPLGGVSATIDSAVTPEIAGDWEALLQSVSLSGEELKVLEADLFLAKGTYTWYQGQVMLSNPPRLIAQDSAPHDKFQGQGRCMFDVYGTVQNVATQKTGQFRFSFSPDVRYRPGTDRLDPWSQTYARF